jgi:hypothetical protein
MKFQATILVSGKTGTGIRVPAEVVAWHAFEADRHLRAHDSVLALADEF